MLHSHATNRFELAMVGDAAIAVRPGSKSFLSASADGNHMLELPSSIAGRRKMARRSRV
jgi:hypothetical protein